MDAIQSFAAKQVLHHKLRDNFYVVDLGRLQCLHTVRLC